MNMDKNPMMPRPGEVLIDCCSCCDAGEVPGVLHEETSGPNRGTGYQFCRLCWKGGVGPYAARSPNAKIHAHISRVGWELMRTLQAQGGDIP
jgi:hypothetical protein